MESIDTLVVGAGVVGLATARALQRSGRDVLVVERQPQFGSETSARNSEVIHAGIYYPPGSLKARLCVRGRTLLYDYCRTRAIAHRRLGKLIVATAPAEREQLQQYASRARANGVDDLHVLSAAETRALEPAVQACGALLSPGTGIVDAHALMTALLADFEAAGGTLACATELTSVAAIDGGIVATFADGYRLRTDHLVNCAGLDAPALAAQLGLARSAGPPYCKAHYYHYRGPSPFSRLIYPVAVKGGLGIHVTLDLAGQLRFGPDVRWVANRDYRFDDSRRAAFIAAIARYFPALDPTRLEPAYTGIRPKLVGPDEPDGDFVIELQRFDRARAVHLLGIESPGLTAALALADEVVARLGITPG